MSRQNDLKSPFLTIRAEESHKEEQLTIRAEDNSDVILPEMT